MKWAEIVRLRTMPGDGLTDRIIDLAGMFKKSPGLIESRVYENAEYQGDLSVCLFWETESSRSQGSEAAFQIRQALKKLGLVDHTVWIDLAKRSAGKALVKVQEGRTQSP
ncbi:MAG: hypothetical protein JXL84_05325 [Deltaproteobacteria bacterium]|nr:hypothetical protein [Deltaproteobacteria bacterium]